MRKRLLFYGISVSIAVFVLCGLGHYCPDPARIGKDWASWCCHNYASAAFNYAKGNASDTFSIYDVSLPGRVSLLETLKPGLAGGHFWIVKAPVQMGVKSHTIVVFYDRPFSNARMPWSRLAYSVGYANGEIGQIAPEEFAQVDQTRFIRADLVLRQIASSSNEVTSSAHAMLAPSFPNSIRERTWMRNSIAPTVDTPSSSEPLPSS